MYKKYCIINIYKLVGMRENNPNELTSSSASPS